MLDEAGEERREQEAAAELDRAEATRRCSSDQPRLRRGEQDEHEGDQVADVVAEAPVCKRLAVVPRPAPNAAGA